MALGKESYGVRLDALSVSAAGRELLREVSLSIVPGQITVIVGGSGSGKTVLLRILAGLLRRDDGAIQWSGRVNIAAPAGREASACVEVPASACQESPKTASEPPVARVGVVFQDFALLDQWPPLDNVQLAIDHRSDLSVPPEQTSSQWLQELRVPTRTPVAVLSGGQKQRLAIARTLAAAPAVVLYDEPTSGLDAASGRQVAELIRRTQETHRSTALVVTHDYQTMLAIADDVLLLDAAAKSLVQVPRDQWEAISQRMQPVRALDEPNDASGDPAPQSSLASARLRVRQLAEATGAVVIDGLRPSGTSMGPIRWKWVCRFCGHYLRLVGGLSALLYLAIAGVIVGFTATYFTFQFLPYRVYTQPLLLEDLLAAIGFALYRVLVPILATILVAARCGAAVAADIGVKRYGSQIDALRTLGVSPRVYLQIPILLAFLVATPLLSAVAFQVARMLSLVCFSSMHPELGPYFWHQHFHRRLIGPQQGLGDTWFESGWDATGWIWVLFKTLLCGAGIAAISYHQGSRPKGSASDVSDSITSTVLWATLFVLVVHFVVALQEF